MRIAMVGTGYVGLVSGTCFAEFGHTVRCIDKDEDKVKSLSAGYIPIYEPGLDELVTKNIEGGRLSFTTSLEKGISDADAIFIAVGTPSRRGQGHADLSFVFAALDEIAPLLRKETIICLKSTVPVGTARQVKAHISKLAPSVTVHVVSNPEFLREGSAIEDFMRPNRIITGCQSEEAKQVMQEIYRPLFLNDTPILDTTWESAEMIKYASNAFLATKIAFINEVADMAETCGANVQDIAKGMGMDQRIGKHFLHAGPGFGGSCFPKDTRALVHTATDLGVKLNIVESVMSSNEDRKLQMADRIIHRLGGDVNGKTIAVLGVTFKPNTDDIRESPSLDIIPALQAQGAAIQAYDPQGMTEAADCLTKVDWKGDSYSAAEGADALVILTEWNEFRALDLERLKAALGYPLVIDLRNIYRPTEMQAAGFDYFSIGREPVHAASAIEFPQKYGT
ncbi:MAG: UDP-glucose dehydrogenase family protein [Alphaproteobacteria bacterium]